VTQIVEFFTTGNSFTLGFDRWRFNPAAGFVPPFWTNEGSFTARMTWLTAPSGYPSPGNYLEGDVKDAGGNVVGRLTMGWVSTFLRKATVEIDRVAQSESPLNNGAGAGWKAIGQAVGWDISVDESDSNLAEPSGASWSDAECHQEMLAKRDQSNLDVEWRYHVLCVRELDSTSRGIMYDAYAGDSNNVPREGCAIASHWVIPNSQQWGTVQGMRFGAATAPYFRTAVHETGHAMGLYHNTADNGFMNTTDTIAANSLSPGSAVFPGNVLWSYNADDAARLRHMPDVYVRPGGTPFGTSYATTPISPPDQVLDMEGVEVTVSPLLDAVPLGAPVRVAIRLAASGNGAVEVPSTVSLRSGCVRGEVTDPTGVVRTFSPLVLCLDDVPRRVLSKGQGVSDSLTLLRGGQGALFPVPGAYRIRVEVRWDVGDVEVTAAGSANVMVTPAADDEHARAAMKVLSTPDTLLTLVLGGDHLKEGISAIQAALESKVLRPHYAHVEAKRLARRFGTRKPDLKAAAKLIDDAAVLSPAEFIAAAGFVAESKDRASARALTQRLKKKVANLSVDDEVRLVLDKL